MGGLAAAMLAAVRLSRHDLALVLVVAFGVARLGLAGAKGWAVASSGIILAAGIYLLALIFDMLGQRGVAFGKFLIVGPLLGALYVALTPLAEYHFLTTNGVTRTLMSRALLGLIVGDAVGFGVEAVELFVHGRGRAGTETVGEA